MPRVAFILEQQQVAHAESSFEVQPAHDTLVVARAVRPQHAAQVMRIVQLQIDALPEVDGVHRAVALVLRAPAAQRVVSGLEGKQLRQVALDRTEGSDGHGGLRGIEAVQAVRGVDEGKVD